MAFVLKQNYPKAKRANYSESSSLESYSQYTDSLKQENEVYFEGIPVSRPLLEFSASFLPKSILNDLQVRNYSAPTQVQKEAWPILLQGRDLLCTAPPGSGKTLAYLIPALMKVQHLKHLAVIDGPLALILSPTRELALQIFSYAQSFERSSGVHSYCIYGGAPKPPQIRNIQQGGGICIATPGRLVDFLKSQVVSLKNCTYLVLDEADYMMEMGFKAQIQNIIRNVAFSTQIILFSASWKEDFYFLTDNVLRDFIVLKIKSSQYPIKRSIYQIVETCQENKKDARMIEILNEIGMNEAFKIIIFTNTKSSTEYITLTLRDLGWYVVGLHSDKLQDDRNSALSSFKIGLVQILVTTDIVSRGVDMQDVIYVINYDFPVSFHDYINRTGRTGRHEKSGTAYTLFTYGDRRHARSLINVLQATEQYVVPELQQFAANYEAQVKKYEYNRNRNSRNRRHDNGKRNLQVGLNLGQG